jgi:hypothetical protein
VRPEFGDISTGGSPPPFELPALRWGQLYEASGLRVIAMLCRSALGSVAQVFAQRGRTATRALIVGMLSNCDSSLANVVRHHSYIRRCSSISAS